MPAKEMVVECSFGTSTARGSLEEGVDLCCNGVVYERYTCDGIERKLGAGRGGEARGCV